MLTTMILLRGSLRAPGRVPPPLTSLRDRLLHIDGELVRAADPDPAHGTRVAALAGRLAHALGWPAAFAEQLRRAAELHDIGKFALPRALLLHAGPLGVGQRELLVLHTHAAGWLLGGLVHPALRLARLVGRGHHERWDGGGYPDGAAGTDIPLPARMVAACDVWDALTHPRPYRPALSPGEAAATLRRVAGTALDPDLGEALLDLLDSCPSSHPPVAT